MTRDPCAYDRMIVRTDGALWRFTFMMFETRERLNSSAPMRLGWEFGTYDQDQAYALIVKFNEGKNGGRGTGTDDGDADRGGGVLGDGHGDTRPRTA